MSVTSGQFKAIAGKDAAAHSPVRKNGSGKCLPELEQTARILSGSFARIEREHASSGEEKEDSRLPSEEWFADNYHVITEQLAAAVQEEKRAGRKAFRDLPITATVPSSLSFSPSPERRGSKGGMRRCLRIYRIAARIVELTDGAADENAVLEYIGAYQESVCLTSREIQAIVPMLRIALLVFVAELCTVQERILAERKEAERFFDKIGRYLGAKGEHDAERRHAVSVWLSGLPSLTPVLAETLLRCAAEKNENTEELRGMMEMQLAERHTSVDRLIETERHVRTGLGVSMGNAVNALAALGSFDTEKIFGELCMAGRILMQDPAGIYGKMLPESRHHYIEQLSHLAASMGISPEQAARNAVALAKGCAETEPGSGTSGGAEPGRDKKRHVGYYIIGKGRQQLLRRRIRRFASPGSGRALLFLSSAAMLAAAALFFFSEAVIRTAFSLYDGAAARVLIPAAVILPAFVVFLNTALSVVQAVFARICRPAVLPSMDFREGIPEEDRVMLIMPVLVTGAKRATELMEELYIISLANREKHLCFAILADFPDSDSREAPADREITEAAREAVAALNRRAGEERFFFFYRRRVYHETERRWMGRERKRGAILDLNNYLLERRNQLEKERGGSRRWQVLEGCSKIESAGGEAPFIRYVFTVDADCKIPPDTVRKMTAVMAHPLNAAEIAERGGTDIVEDGYGILQPETVPGAVRGGRSRFAAAFTGFAGVDSYFPKTSDFYFDACREGIYTGKGLYEPAVFNRVAGQLFRKETVLSHDLIEGSYLRTAPVSEVPVYDGFPNSYLSYAKRLHRWIRGDWQLLPYKKSSFVDGRGKKIQNPLNFVSLYKINNNIYRSLFAPALLVLGIALTWLLPPFSWLAPLLVAAAVFLPFFLGASGETAKQCLLRLCFLPHEAVSALDAILRTCWRVRVSGRHLLEWVTAEAAEKRAAADLKSYIKEMWICFPAAVLMPGPLSLLWAAAPFVAFRLSSTESLPEGKRPQFDGTPVSGQEKNLLRACTRRIWGFYEDLATEAHSFLPPDNIQFSPGRKVACRTSPTNIGFYLLSSVLAWRFGYLTLAECAGRLRSTLDTVDRLEKWNGHLLNWYDTGTLAVLAPAFVSSADSGNLAVCCKTAAALLAEAVKELEAQGEEHFLGKESRRLGEGIFDTVCVYNEAAPQELQIPAGICSLFLLREESYGAENRRRKAAEACLQFLMHSEGGAALPESCKVWRRKLTALLRNAGSAGKKDALPSVCSEVRTLAERLRLLAENMNFTPLYNPQKKLLSVGFSVRENRRVNAHYDLIASEARLACFFAVSKGDLPAEAFYKMGRRRACAGGILLSWSGTAFEYLLPELFLYEFDHLLWQETSLRMLRGQIRFGELLGTPWGVSESGYNARDLNGNYRYRAFGIPCHRLKREEPGDAVIAPYASLLGICHLPQEVIRNLSRLKRDGAWGLYGFYEAYDYTPGRRGAVESFMAHHLGMSFAALANFRDGFSVARAYSSLPETRAYESLIAEKPAGGGERHGGRSSRIEKEDVLAENALAACAGRGKAKTPDVLGKGKKEKDGGGQENAQKEDLCVRESHDAGGSLPETALLSGGRYTVMIDERGCGFSKCGDIEISEWNPLGLSGAPGMQIFVRSRETGEIFNTAGADGLSADDYKVWFEPGRARFFKRCGSLLCETEIAVSGEEDAELRRLSVTSTAEKPVWAEVTVFLRLVLNRSGQFAAHPAFSDLFVVTGGRAEEDRVTVGAMRRRKEETEPACFAALSLSGSGAFAGGTQFDTDLLTFYGRNNLSGVPESVARGTPLAMRQGAVLLPCFAVRGAVSVQPGETVSLRVTMAFAESRERLEAVTERLSENRNFLRAFEFAAAGSKVEKERLGIRTGEYTLFGKLLPRVLYGNLLGSRYESPGSRCKDAVRILWSQGISCDRPIAAVFVRNAENGEFIKKAVRFHSFAVLRGLPLDMVIVAGDRDSYRSPVKNLAESAAAAAESLVGRENGAVYVLSAQKADREFTDALLTAACLVLKPGSLQSVRDITEAGEAPEKYRRAYLPMPFSGNREKQRETAPSRLWEQDGGLAFYNGYGGFSEATGEYVIRKTGLPLPLPWINCITGFASDFGFTVSDAGGGFVFRGNSHENRITPWTGDAVQDMPVECIYIRKEDGTLLTPSPLPARDGDFASFFSECTVRHGFGYTVFSRREAMLELTLTVFAAAEEPVKLSLLKIVNLAEEAVSLDLVYYFKVLMGDLFARRARYTVSCRSENEDALLFYNFRLAQAGAMTVFAAQSLTTDSYTCDNTEFEGIGGTPAAPVYFSAENRAEDGTLPELQNRTGSGYVPCAALKSHLKIAPGGTASTVFMVGETFSDRERAEILAKCRNPYRAEKMLSHVQALWREWLSCVQVETPDPALDLMMNGRLLYQVKACRMDGRSALFQSGGAYGFRDQLQDSLALLFTDPGAVRKQLLLHAAAQYEEGDVAHWWHPPERAGVRSRCSDDLLWLPYCTWCYVRHTGDVSVLHEEIPFLKSPVLAPEEPERYEIPAVSGERASLYGHCLRAVQKALRFGRHGLPLMGSGDWNDGMNTVGHLGEGESVWLGWFLCAVLGGMEELRQTVGAERQFFPEIRERLLRAIEENAWDRDHYVRAFYDNGKPLGVWSDPACRIDSVAQSWSVISGLGDRERRKKAIDTAFQYLADRESGVIRLLTPPFAEPFPAETRGRRREDEALPEKKTAPKGQSPGYIAAYPPGVRENGAQYTHAAIWLAKAFLMENDAETGYEMLSMLNPIHHSRTPAEAVRYKTEPYAVAADVLSGGDRNGRGGWSWYTGSAAWYYRVILEDLLGVTRCGDRLLLDPKLPAAWNGRAFVTLRIEGETYRLDLSQGKRTVQLKKTEKEE